MTHKYQLVKNRAVPKDQRWVENPILNCKECVVSDVIPTDAISQALIDGLTAGTVLFGEVDWGGSPVGTPFDGYILRQMTRASIPGYTRLYFTKSLTVDLDDPFSTVTQADDETRWDPILIGIRFIKDTSAPMSTMDGTGKVVAVPRYFERIFYIDGQVGGTLIKDEHYVSSEYLEIPQLEVPMPTTVSYHYYNVKGSFGKCLHKKLVIDAKQGAFAAFDTVTETSGVATSSISGQGFEATNFETWETYTSSFKLVNDGLLKEYVRRTLVPPDLPAISVA